MGKCVFRAKDVIPLIKHAVETAGGPNAKHRQPALLLVHDSGVYLMSNGSPNLPREDGKEGSHVVYAEGCNPNIGTFDEWYSNSRELVGGDDFTEPLPIRDPNQWLRDCSAYDLLILYVNPSSIQIAFGHDAPTEIHS